MHLVAGCPGLARYVFCHECLLFAIASWHRLDWKKLGFQGVDPATDVRTGAWPLEQLATCLSADALRVFACSPSVAVAPSRQASFARHRPRVTRLLSAIPLPAVCVMGVVFCDFAGQRSPACKPQLYLTAFRTSRKWCHSCRY